MAPDRINRGKIELRRERVDVSSVVLNAVDAARPLCENLQHELTVTVPSDPVFVNADPARLAQIVGNLLNNACKFTPRGGHIWFTVDRQATTTERSVIPPLRILIVDDNRDSADMLATLLTFSGHETYTANDGLAAVDQAANLQPDVILMDIGLPVLNGYEAARRIRELPCDKRPVLVALTGWGQDADRRRSESAGFDAHLVKPVDDRVLGKLLVELRNGTAA